MQEAMAMKLFIDLCSGLGGASEAFLGDPLWEVYRVEIRGEPEFQDLPSTHQHDVKNWIDWLPSLASERYEQVVIWASPPCLEFSNAMWAPRAIHSRESTEEYEPDMDIFDACLAIIEHVKPTFWVIENVAGSIPFFTPELGKFTQKIGPFFLWGVFPYIDVGPYFTHRKADNDVHSSNPLRANIKAKIPFEVSRALLHTITHHVGIDKWI